MLYKHFLAIVISALFCMQGIQSQAKEISISKDSIKTVSIKKSKSIRRIDTLSLSPREKELASSHIKELLDNQLSPLRSEMKKNHNEDVQAYINKYTSSNFRAHLAKMKGLASYYFPIFEKVFNETDVPTEIKYLAIVESSLNPHAVSRVGATGPWQFMFATAKGYGLKMDAYVDERKDPFEATYAAASYLKKAYDVYGDWFLAIASYNCGQGNVDRAINRSGKSNPTFWDIQEYLPRETRNYVPAFIAMGHVLGNANLFPVEADLTDFPEDIDVIQIDKQLSLQAVAKTLEIEPDDLYRLNPSYKKKVIKGSPGNPSRLIVPKVEKESYAKLYAFLQGGSSVLDIKKPQELSPTNVKQSSYIAYKVQKGDTLDAISKRFKGSSVSSLRAANNLKGSMIKPGMTLKISQNL